MKFNISMCKKFLVLLLLSGAFANMLSAADDEKADFDKVTSKLDSGGNFYLYVSTEDSFKSIVSLLEKLRETLSASVRDQATRGRIKAGFEFALSLLKSSGIFDINGLGLSSKELEKGTYRNRIFVYRPADKNQGIIWHMMGSKPQKLDALKLLPSDTAVAVFTNLDPLMLWKWFKQKSAESKLDNLKKNLAEFEKQLELQGVPLEKLLASIDNKIGFIIALDAEKKALLPIGKNLVDIQEPALVLMIKVKDDSIYKVLQSKIPHTALQQDQEQKDIKKFLIPFKAPITITITPIVAQTPEYLIIASNESILDKIMDAEKTGKGLTADAEFKKLSARIPETGNGFKYISPKLMKTVAGIQKKIMASSGAPQANKLIEDINSMYGGDFFLYQVIQNTDEGFLITANSSFKVSNLVFMQATMGPSAILAGMLLPALNNARQKARTICDTNNLKQIGLGLMLYGNDHNDEYPASDGAAGLQELITGDYLTDRKLLVSPLSNSHKPAAPGVPLTESNCSYVYFGGFSPGKLNEASAIVPVAFTKPGLAKSVNVLFTDGHVQNFRQPFSNCVEVIDILNSRYHYKPELLETLKKKALEADKTQ